jgi:hypothetical protein
MMARKFVAESLLWVAEVAVSLMTAEKGNPKACTSDAASGLEATGPGGA